MDEENPNPDVRKTGGLLQKLACRLLLYCGAILAFVGIAVLGWEMLIKVQPPTESFQWTPLLIVIGCLGVSYLAFSGAHNLGAPNVGNWTKGIGTATLAIFIWSQVNRNKRNEADAGKPGLQGRELLRQQQDVRPQTGNQSGSR